MWYRRGCDGRVGVCSFCGKGWLLVYLCCLFVDWGIVNDFCMSEGRDGGFNGGFFVSFFNRIKDVGNGKWCSLFWIEGYNLLV